MFLKSDKKSVKYFHPIILQKRRGTHFLFLNFWYFGNIANGINAQDVCYFIQWPEDLKSQGCHQNKFLHNCHFFMENVFIPRGLNLLPSPQAIPVSGPLSPDSQYQIARSVTGGCTGSVTSGAKSYWFRNSRNHVLWSSASVNLYPCNAGIHTKERQGRNV